MNDSAAERTKRKRVVSVLSRQAARMVKEDERILKKRRATTPEPKMTEIEEGTPSTPSVVEVEEILKVMTETLPIKLLSPLGPQLTKLLQKKVEPYAVKKAVGPKKRRIITVTQAIEETPPPASASKMTPAAEAATFAEAAATEATNLGSTLSAIDKVLSDMATEETTVATKEITAAAPEKEKEIVEDASEEEHFNLWNLIGEELSEAEKKSYKSMLHPVVISQGPCFLVALMKKP
jgi:hypothetical protein